MKKKLIAIVFILLAPVLLKAQYAQYQFDKDSIGYPYFLPFLGKKTVEAGFDIPYPIGVGVNSFWARQNMLIDNLSLGFTTENQDIPLTDVSHIIKFGEVLSEVYSVTVRPDVWIFPFLNVYGILGKSYTTTAVLLSDPIEMESIVDLTGESYGIGTTGAFGLGKYFVVLDGNWVWTKMESFSEAVKTATFSQRIGRSFKIGKKPESNLAIWVGAMRLRLESNTDGSIRMDEALSEEVWERKDEIVDDYWTWYNSLGPLDPKKKIADEILTPIVDKIDAADGSGTVHYNLDKKPKSEWNMLFGGQYQINKNWQVRAEGGILGDRSSFLLSANYRFGFKSGHKLRK